MVINDVQLFAAHEQAELLEVVQFPGEQVLDIAQLQIVCHRLYEEKSPGSDVITQRDYEKLGRAPKILSDYLDDVLRHLSLPERRIARAILKQMAVSSELKATRSLERIAQELGQARAFAKGGLGNMNQVQIQMNQFNMLVSKISSQKSPEERLKSLGKIYEAIDNADKSGKE